MRTSALSPLLVLGALVAPARADHKEPVKAPEQVATALPSGRGAAPVASVTGDLGITGARPARKDPFLSAREVATEVRAYAPDIERCYLAHLDDVRRAGHLDLTFVIGRDGAIASLKAAAPTLPARAARKVESCIREAVEVLRFPERRNDTTAVVPYYFQHTETPGGGPQLSCWNPRGCH
ncbi:MAG: AgmX/PglI C-terminal domain-containing protein [Deltaproteobacteria bacterium]|nr:MAG: AgmX/PglI C-terminal domain-containing protein [Deltaproteobacteria bacterium]